MEDLARRMSELDERAYEDFAKYFGPRLRAWFLRRGLSPVDAEELAISCVTDIALKVGQYRPVAGGGFEAWVFTLARHSLSAWWRARPATEPLSKNLPSELTAEDELGIDSEIISAVRDALAQLSESDRAVIQAKDLNDDQTFAEAGATLGLTKGAARVRHCRALKRLQALLERDERIIRHLKRRSGLKS